MLQNQQNEESGTAYVSPIANLKVTPEELAQAVGAIEARRDLHGTSDKIAIGEAIQQLGLNMTPQEVYAEVRNQQARTVTPSLASPVSATTAPPRQRRGFRSVAGRLIFVGSIALNMYLITHPSVQHYAEAPQSAMTAPSSSLQKIPASSISGEQSGFARLDDIYELANGKKAESVMVSQESAPSSQHNWKLVRLGNELHVRGWTFRGGNFVLNGSSVFDPLNLFADKWTEEQVPLTVPLSQFKNIKDPKYMVAGGDTPGVSLPSSGN
jgi:hypothetical protein